MPKPDPLLSKPLARSTRRRTRRRPRSTLTRRLARHTPLLEIGARLGINTFLAGVALLALGRLVPHMQSQAAQLEDVNQALARVEASTSRLKTDFGRYFDPWQAENIMQEQSGYRPPSERQVVWTDDGEATATPADDEAEPQEDTSAETNGAIEPTTEEASAGAESSDPESAD
jgi:hypothetical protein